MLNTLSCDSCLLEFSKKKHSQQSASHSSRRQLIVEQHLSIIRTYMLSLVAWLNNIKRNYFLQ